MDKNGELLMVDNECDDGGSKFSLLQVEDDLVSGSLVGKILSLKYPNMKLFNAGDGEIGLEMFKEHRPDIVLTDISMPKMDGLTMAAKIKTCYPDVPIIVVSAYCDVPQYHSRVKDVGIEYCLLKPLDFNKLFDAIEKSTAENSQYCSLK